jgi:alanine racemase
MEIAVLPIGYADGFRRLFGNGRGFVFINDHKCMVLGNVCMDMTMVDITDLSAKAGDEVEIIGTHQSLEKLASAMNTIPYEVLTSISKRVHRVYLEE